MDKHAFCALQIRVRPEPGGDTGLIGHKIRRRACWRKFAASVLRGTPSVADSVVDGEGFVGRLAPDTRGRRELGGRDAPSWLSDSDFRSPPRYRIVRLCRQTTCD